MDSILPSLFPSLPQSPLNQGISNLISQNKTFASLLQHKRLPDVGWDDLTIQSFLLLLRQLDTNQPRTASSLYDPHLESSSRWCGVGEREGRVYSQLVANRHFGFSHGMGRSGDIAEVQPKAVGSSILVQLTTCLALDAMRRGAGLTLESTRFGLLLPLCTGMSMALVLSTLSSFDPTRKIVLWSRIDQKSCLKAITTAGLTCVVIPTRVELDEVVCDLNALAALIQQYEGNIVAVVTTTSCFAPRIPDPIDDIAKLCQNANISHIVNNAYGIQCPQICKRIHRACVVGRVDAMICSMDKNFMVPVGGAIVTTPKKQIMEAIGKTYAGRASSSAVMDLCITLLSMGLNGYKRILETRHNLVPQFTAKFHDVAAKYGGRLLSCPKNTISFAITLDHLASKIASPELEKLHLSTEQEADDPDSKLNRQEQEVSSLSHKSQDMDTLESNAKAISYFGSMLFTRCVSGTRVIPIHEIKEVCGHRFRGYGSSTDEYRHSYLTAACAVGLTQFEMDDFFNRLDKCFQDYFATRAKKKVGL